MSIQKIAGAYGISITTVHSWRRRGVTLDDFRDPAVVFRKLCDTLRNDSPRLRALRDKNTQLEICFRMAVADINPPNEK
jgi:transposase-like protein